LLKKVRDLGMPLVSISPFEPGQEDVSNIKSQIGAASCLRQNQSQQGDKK